MLPAGSYSEMLEELRRRYKKRKAIGVLLSRSSTNFFKEEIEDHIDYYHERAGKKMDFYFPGYGAYWPESEYKDQKEVCKVEDTIWLYSNKAFVEFIYNLEKNSSYRFSGESELILIDFVEGELDFNNIMILQLDKMVKDNVVSSFKTFFEELFQSFCKHKTTYDISDALTVNSLISNLFQTICEKLPLNLGRTFNRAKYFCVVKK